MSFRSLGKNSILFKLIIAFLIAVPLDVIDYFGGFIPILGDIVDIIAVLVLFPLIGPLSVVGLVELIPVVDFLPTFIGLVITRFVFYGATRR